MGLFSRLGTLIKSNLNDIISKAEDPEKMLNQVLVEMRNHHIEAKKQVAVAIGDEKRLKKQYEDQVSSARDWERKAMLAVQAGDDELAKEALARKEEHDELAIKFEEQWQLQKSAVDKLKDELRLLKGRIEEASRKRNLLVARAKRAEAQKTIQATMSGLSDTSAFDTFERMADKVDRLEAEAEAQSDIANDLNGDSLENKFKKLESRATSSDQSLAALKAKMGLAAPAQEQKSLPAQAESGKDAKGKGAKSAAPPATPSDDDLGLDDVE